MNFNEYSKMKGFIWGLHNNTLEYIYNYIKNNKDNIHRILEFGSGSSTKFLIDVRKELNLDYSVTSFDHLIDFSFNNISSGFTLNIRNLIKYNDDVYNQMFDELKVSVNYEIVEDNGKEGLQNELYSTRVKNTFYEIDEGDIDGVYDIVILDGPNGNGRNISYLHFMNNIRKGTLLVIDDYYHYDFLDKCKLVFDVDVLDVRKFPGGNKGHAMVFIKGIKEEIKMKHKK